MATKKTPLNTTMGIYQVINNPEFKLKIANSPRPLYDERNNLEARPLPNTPHEQPLSRTET